jgi:4-carboxymuconolactone decarboxylase
VQEEAILNTERYERGWNQLSVHIGSALNVGLSPEEIIEIALHCIPYVGFPKVMNAISIVREVFTERGIEWFAA